MIEAIWPQYRRLPNSIPESQGATTQGFLSFFLFWCGRLPLTVALTNHQAVATSLRLHPPFEAEVDFQHQGDCRADCRFGNVDLGESPCYIEIPRLILQAIKLAGSGASEALSNPAGRAAPGAPRFIAFMYSVTACQGTWATMSEWDCQVAWLSC